MAGHLDLEASQRLENRIREAGIRVQRWGKILEVQRRTRGYRVIAEEGEIDTEMVSASVGATAMTDLAASAKIPLQDDEPHGMKVGPDMKTEVEGIYAAGDCAAPLPGASWGLWHSAEDAGMTAGINMAGGDSRPAPKPRRLKCEAFGGYLFSLNYRSVSSDERAEPGCSGTRQHCILGCGYTKAVAWARCWICIPTQGNCWLNRLENIWKG